MMHGSEWDMEMWRPEVENVTRGCSPSMTFSTAGCHNFHVPRTTVSYVLSYHQVQESWIISERNVIESETRDKMVVWEFCLQDGGVSESFTHRMAAWEICLQDGSVSESFTHKLAAWKFCLQDVGVSDSFTYKMAAWEICLQDGGNSAFLRDLPTRWRRFWEFRLYIMFAMFTL